MLFALAMIWHTRTFPMPGQDYSPALFPVLIGIGFYVTGLILIVSGLRRQKTERGSRRRVAALRPHVAEFAP